MKSQQIPMTMDEFQLMPWQLGWKHEYSDGMAFLTPRQQSVSTVINVELRTVQSMPCQIRSVVPDDAQGLLQLYFHVFQDSVEFCNYQEEEIKRSAKRCIEKYFRSIEDASSSLSKVAISPDGVVIGAALIVIGDKHQPFLRLLCISPTWQRQGIATAMVAIILNELANQNYLQLKSRYFLANEISRNWHHKFGFEDEPDLFVTRLYFRHAQHELWRQKQLGELNDSELSALETKVQTWQRQVDLQEAEWRKSFLDNSND